jgi:hypothetical protein
MRHLLPRRRLAAPLLAALVLAGCGEADTPQAKVPASPDKMGGPSDAGDQLGEFEASDMGSGRMAAQVIKYFQEPLSEEEIVIKIDRGGSEALSEVFGICDQTDWARLRAFGFSEGFLVQLRTKALPDCAAQFDAAAEALEAAPTEASAP